MTGPDGDPGNAGIARQLNIGTATVKTHIASALAKLGLHHRSELRWIVPVGSTGDSRGDSSRDSTGS